MIVRRTATLALAAISISAACAQTNVVQTSHLRGTVRDPLGAAVPNAKIELFAAGLNAATVAVTATSAPDGSYDLPIGASRRFRLRVTAPTFRPTFVTTPFLTSSTDASLDLTLDTPTYSEQVTVTATGTPTPLAQSGAPITVLNQSADYPHSPELQQPLRLVPGVQLTQNGQTGGATSLFIRGGDSGSTKVLLDGTPLNDIGGAVNFANLASVGVSKIEVLRQPSSALYGSDALAGVLQFTSARGTSPLPLFAYALDGGNYGFFRQEADLSGAHRNFDYYNAFARLNTSNSIAANAFHNATFAGNYGYAPTETTTLRLTLRHLATNGGQPNAIALYGIPDSASASEHDLYLNASLNNQTTPRWHNQLQYGRERLRSQFSDYAATGIPDSFGDYDGKKLTISGANGYSVTGQAIFQYGGGTYPNFFNTSTNRDFVYAQSDYKFTNHLTGLAAFRYEDERGTTLYRAGYSSISTVDHGNYSGTLQLAGDVKSRLFYVLGSGIEDNAVYGKALTPRASLAYYLIRPGQQVIFSGTKLHASFGKGLLGPNVGQENSSLYDTLQLNAPAIIPQYNIHPLSAEYSRTYDAGVEQQFGNGRARLNLTFFHNEFTNGFQYVSVAALQTLGVPKAAALATGYGAYTNAQAFRALGAESELEYRLASHLFARAGYTYLDAVIQHSFSSDALKPSFNKSSNFANIAIGAYAPLDGARPFRRAPHTGYFALQYTSARFDTQLSGTLVSRRDDSTFLTDSNFGNTLLLPNRNLDGAYQRIELTTTYRLTHNLSTYANLQNLLNEHYQEAFGYPALPFNLRGGVKLTFGGESFHLR